VFVSLAIGRRYLHARDVRAIRRLFASRGSLACSTSRLTIAPASICGGAGFLPFQSEQKARSDLPEGMTMR